jgi:hypothetical protein
VRAGEGDDGRDIEAELNAIRLLRTEQTAKNETLFPTAVRLVDIVRLT